MTLDPVSFVAGITVGVLVFGLIGRYYYRR